MQEKLSKILNHVKKNGISAYSISKGTGISEAGIGKIVNKISTNPNANTVLSIYDFLFSKSKEPISRNLVLKNVWNYSEETETHTVETHIHRLRKKILEKFGDNNFIKNDNKGYYIWKKNHEILSPEIYFLQNIKKELLNLKKVRGVIKEKK